MTLREMILSTDDFQLVRRGSTPKGTLRAAYEVAQAGSDCVGLNEPPDGMFRRTGHFIVHYQHALDQIAGEIYVDLGLAGGVAPGTIVDIKHLSTPDAKKLANITLAQHESNTIMKDLISTMAAWAAKGA